MGNSNPSKGRIMSIKRKRNKYRASIELDGVSISSKIERIKFDNYCATLRQPASEEARFDIHGFVTSIMEIEGDFRNYEELDRSIEQALAILRLFNVGSVEKIWVERSSEIVPDYGGGKILATYPHITPERYEIQHQDIGVLQRFWRHCWDIEILSLLKNPELGGEYVGVAYSRYCDSLFVTHVEEGRIASIVMGLESIIVPERDELRYRLKTRIGKLFGLLGFKGNEISDKIGTAYIIRSDHVHGSYMRKGMKNEIEKYGGISAYINELTDILRISILVFILLRVNSNKARESFIKLIDESLLDLGKEQSIKDQLAKVRQEIPGLDKNR